MPNSLTQICYFQRRLAAGSENFGLAVWPNILHKNQFWFGIFGIIFCIWHWNL